MKTLEAADTGFYQQICKTLWKTSIFNEYRNKWTRIHTIRKRQLKFSGRIMKKNA